MCYALYLSTTSREDLSKFNSDKVRFEQAKPQDEGTERLLHPQKWYVGSKSGCSCTFRHLSSIELGFSEPVDWAPEEKDEITATAELYRVIQRIISEGYSVDILDLWVGMERGEVTKMKVDLNLVPEMDFRLFENHHFVFDG